MPFPIWPEMNIIMSRAVQQQQYPHRLPPTMTPTSPLDFTDRIPFKEIELANETLGFGSFGTVFKGRWRGRLVAVKQFKTREQIDSFLVEVKQLSCVKHPNIVTLYGASSLTDTAYLIMEYAERGSLNHLLHEDRQQQYDLRHACSWAMQAARGVAYLHGIRPKPIMHRDLKPANLLLFSRGKILKIGDFGTACTVKTQMTNNTGSASYMAPEVFATSSYLESGDVFSWSIIFWEILARRPPYSQEYSNPYQILWRVKQEGTRPSELEDCPKIIWNLITKSWSKDPKKRPSMKDITDEMEFIFSLTEKSALSDSTITNSQRQKSPHRHHIPMSSHLINQNYSLHYNIQTAQQVHSFATTIDENKSINGGVVTPEAKCETYRNYRVLLCSLRLLQKRAQELEECASANKKITALELIKEIEELQEKTNEMRRQKSKLEQPVTFDDASS